LTKLQFYLNTTQINAFQKASTKSIAPTALQNIHSMITAKSSGKREAAEMKYETTVLQHEINGVIQYLQKNTGSKNITYHALPISNINTEVGAGMIGMLDKPILTKTFFSRLKSSMKLKGFRHTADLGRKIQKVAVCGGAGGFLLGQAIRAGADIFITSDYKYHEFFDADGKIIIADIGHYESEQYTIELLHGLIKKNFSNFASHCTKLSTNPVFYY